MPAEQLYKLTIFCPDDPQIIMDIIQAASKAGAGTIGNYNECSFVTKGIATWRPNKDSDPTFGRVGRWEKINEARIEMHCPETVLEAVGKAVRAEFAYEEPVIEAIPIRRI